MITIHLSFVFLIICTSCTSFIHIFLTCIIKYIGGIKMEERIETMDDVAKENEE